MTNTSGNQVESTNYMPFGGMRAHSGTTTSNYKFTDQELDAENGLYNYNARMYDPIIGRFISADPIVPEPYNPQSLNRYSYCLNNPLIYVDPSGYEEMEEFILDEIVITEKRNNPNAGAKAYEEQELLYMLKEDPTYNPQGPEDAAGIGGDKTLTYPSANETLESLQGIAVTTLNKLLQTKEFKEAEERLKRIFKIEVNKTESGKSEFDYLNVKITINPLDLAGHYRSGTYYYPMSMERLIAHEVGHSLYGRDEQDAIDFENYFMSIYYNNPYNMTAPQK